MPLPFPICWLSFTILSGNGNFASSLGRISKHVHPALDILWHLSFVLLSLHTKYIFNVATLTAVEMREREVHKSCGRAQRSGAVTDLRVGGSDAQERRVGAVSFIVKMGFK